MSAPDVFESDEQPIAWFRLTVGYMPPGTNEAGRTYRTSRVAWFLESDDELPPDDITFSERNSWRVWGDGEGQDVGTGLGATILGELLPTLSWWAGHAERKQCAHVAAALGEAEPPAAVRVRLIPMVVAALIEQATVDLPELDAPGARTGEEVGELLRDEVVRLVRAEHQRELASVRDVLVTLRASFASLTPYQEAAFEQLRQLAEVKP
jgi:hypothetical protein